MPQETIIYLTDRRREFAMAQRNRELEKQLASIIADNNINKRRKTDVRRELSPLERATFIIYLIAAVIAIGSFAFAWFNFVYG